MSAAPRLVIYSAPGSDLHKVLCDAFLLHGGWTTIDEDFYEVIGMSPGWGPGARQTRWLLRPAPAGQA